MQKKWLSVIAAAAIFGAKKAWVVMKNDEIVRSNGVIMQMTKLINDKGLAAIFWQQGLVNYIKGFDND